MDKKVKQCVKLLRQLVSNVQGAPYPVDDVKKDLYAIWYEHAQRAAMESFEFLNDNFPNEEKIKKSVDKIIGEEEGETEKTQAVE